MKRKRLLRTVVISGKNILGKECSVTFTPAHVDGWFLQTKTHGIIPINFRIARHREGRIQLHAGGTTINVWEHIGALRFFGVDGVIITCSSKWPPYLGGMGGYYPHFLKEGTLVEDGEFPLIRPVRQYSYETHNHIQASTAITYGPRLKLMVYAKWGTLPWYNQHLDVEEIPPLLWKQIWNAKPQGWLKGRNPIASLVIRLLKRKNYENVAWIDTFENEEAVAYAWGLHRVQDILGCLSLCDYAALPVMNFESYCAGHREDLIVLKECFETRPSRKGGLLFFTKRAV